MSLRFQRKGSSARSLIQMSKHEIRRQQDEVRRLKDEKRAIILSHFYQRAEIQEIGDFLGDSLELCKKAASIEDKDIIVFNGVDFMAETASIVNPERKVLLPVLKATCPMAHMLEAEEVRSYKRKYPKATVVLYVNTLAEAKAEAYATCTSANATKVVSNIDNDQILFGPDDNLADYIRNYCPDKEIISMPEMGFCYTHRRFSLENVLHWRRELPHAKVIVHPECRIEVQKAADAVCSTNQMVAYVKSSTAADFVIGTETGLISYLEREVPQKKYYPLLSDARCYSMKKNTLKDVINSLQLRQHVVKIDPKIATRARKAIDQMFELTA